MSPSSSPSSSSYILSSSSYVRGYWDIIKSKVSTISLREDAEDTSLWQQQQQQSQSWPGSGIVSSLVASLFAPSPSSGPGLPSLRHQQDAARYFTNLVMRFLATSRLADLPRVDQRFWEDLNIPSPLEVIRCALEEALASSPKQYDLSALDALVNDPALMEELTRRERALRQRVEALIQQHPDLVQEIDERVFAAHWFDTNTNTNTNSLPSKRDRTGRDKSGGDLSYLAALHSLLTAVCHTEDPKLQQILQRSISTLSYWAKVANTGESTEVPQIQDILWGGVASVISEAVSSPDPQLSLDALAALATFSETRHYGERVVSHGGLALLRKVIIENFTDSPSPALRLALSREAARLLANVAFSELNHVSIVGEGFVPILKNWAQSPDLELQSHAKRALLNLAAASAALDLGYESPSSSSSSAPKPRYADGVFLLSDLTTSENAAVDVVFVHGLLGGAFVTWRFDDGSDNSITLGTSPEVAADTCWPRDLLAKEFPGARIIALNFQTALSEWTAHPARSAKTLLERSQEFLEKLSEAQVGNGRPVVFVAHSMGGLIVKQMLLEAQADPARASLAENTKGVVFYSTPHNGSWLANYFKTLTGVLRLSIEVTELTTGSKFLQDLNDRFRQLFAENRAILSFGETVETSFIRTSGKPAAASKDEFPATTVAAVAPKKGPLDLTVLVVPSESSHPGYGQFVSVPKDHVQICKPSSQEDAVYLYPKLLLSRLTTPQAPKPETSA